MTNIHEVVEGNQQIRRGEGVTFQLTTTNWESDPDPAAIVITRRSDGTDVTAAFTTTAVATASGDVITLPEITVPSDAELGFYRVDIPFDAGGFDPARPYLDLEVIA